jgi:hypothetical protein
MAYRHVAENTVRSNAPQCPTLYASAHGDLVGDLAQHGRGDETYVTVKLHIGSRHRAVHRHGRADSGIMWVILSSGSSCGGWSSGNDFAR